VFWLVVESVAVSQEPAHPAHVGRYATVIELVPDVISHNLKEDLCKAHGLRNAREIRDRLFLFE
jgi:hypothetical protein